MNPISRMAFGQITVTRYKADSFKIDVNNSGTPDLKTYATLIPKANRQSQDYSFHVGRHPGNGLFVNYRHSSYAKMPLLLQLARQSGDQALQSMIISGAAEEIARANHQHVNHQGILDSLIQIFKSNSFLKQH